MSANFDDIYQAIYAKLYSIAVGRGGYVSEGEAEGCGLSSKLLSEALLRGHLVRVSEGALRLSLFPASRHEPIFAVWLALGSRGVVSCQSALGLLDLCDPGKELHLSYP